MSFLARISRITIFRLYKINSSKSGSCYTFDMDLRSCIILQYSILFTKYIEIFYYQLKTWLFIAHLTGFFLFLSFKWSHLFLKMYLGIFLIFRSHTHTHKYVIEILLNVCKHFIFIEVIHSKLVFSLCMLLF